MDAGEKELMSSLKSKLAPALDVSKKQSTKIDAQSKDMDDLRKKLSHSSKEAERNAKRLKKSEKIFAGIMDEVPELRSKEDLLCAFSELKQKASAAPAAEREESCIADLKLENQALRTKLSDMMASAKQIKREN